MKTTVERVTMSLAFLVATVLLSGVWAQAGSKPAKARAEYEDPCPSDMCDNGIPNFPQEKYAPRTKGPCGIVAQLNALAALCGSFDIAKFKAKTMAIGMTENGFFPSVSIPFTGIFFNFGSEIQSFGIPARAMRYQLNRNFRRQGKNCPDGRWRVNNDNKSGARGRFIPQLARRSSEYSPTLVLVNLRPGTWFKLHWYVVEKVTNLGQTSCKVWIKDTKGRGWYPCRKFRDMAFAIPLVTFTRNGSFLYFE